MTVTFGAPVAEQVTINADVPLSITGRSSSGNRTGVIA
jgi:hypothetical protein